MVPSYSYTYEGTTTNSIGHFSVNQIAFSNLCRTFGDVIRLFNDRHRGESYVPPPQRIFASACVFALSTAIGEFSISTGGPPLSLSFFLSGQKSMGRESQKEAERKGIALEALMAPNMHVNGSLY